VTDRQLCLASKMCVTLQDSIIDSFCLHVAAMIMDMYIIVDETLVNMSVLKDPQHTRNVEIALYICIYLLRKTLFNAFLDARAESVEIS
jgi:hypothetical protein